MRWKETEKETQKDGVRERDGEGEGEGEREGERETERLGDGEGGRERGRESRRKREGRGRGREEGRKREGGRGREIGREGGGDVKSRRFADTTAQEAGRAASARRRGDRPVRTGADPKAGRVGSRGCGVWRGGWTDRRRRARVGSRSGKMKALAAREAGARCGHAGKRLLAIARARARTR